MSCIAPRCVSARDVGALFCKTHLAAPSGTRGGWISAWRRAQARANAPQPLDASNVAKRLWVGAAPPFDRDLPGFDVLVLCAQEIQGKHPFHGRTYRCPLPDGELTPGEIVISVSIARAVAVDVAEGRRVLVTCHKGLNRSALIAGLSLCVLTRAPGHAIVENIRRQRPRALGNPFFVELIRRYARHRSPSRSPRR